VGGRGQFLQAFSGEVYDFYSASPEYFEKLPVHYLRTLLNVAVPNMKECSM
jgi:hypothetical protein